MRFSFKILLSCLLAGIIPTVLVVVAVYFITSSVYVEMTSMSISSSKNGSEYIINTRIEEVSRQGAALAQSAPLAALASSRDEKNFAEFFQPLFEAGALDYAAIFDEEGQPVLLAQSKALGGKLDPGAVLAGGVTDAAVPSTTAPNMVDIKFSADLINDQNVRAGRLVAGSFIFNEAFLDELKGMFGAEFTIFRGDTRSMTTLVNNGQRVIGTKMANPTVLERVLQRGEVFQDKNVILGANFDTVYWPIRGADEAVIGMYFLGMPATIVERTQRNFFITAGVLIVVTSLLVLAGAGLVSRSINRHLVRVMERMGNSFKQVRLAVEDINKSSDAMAQGANVQASSLEKTSAALEQMSAMIHQTAENSAKTNTENQEVDRQITEGSKLVREMGTAMNEISESAEKIGAIIKTIESIAFQTNLLALNASVEAARAGEAGAGFAVVADEVRNLAQRSTQAAGDTNSLISGTVSRVKNGARISGLLSESFENIRHGSGVVGDLIDGIAVAGKEQFQGVEQVNQAVSEINRVAGSNNEATAATASASRELAIAADELHEVMLDLSEMVTGRADLEGAEGAGERKLLE